MTREEALKSIGREVIYQPYMGARREVGVISSVGEQYVHVLYLGDRYPKATCLGDLSLRSGDGTRTNLIDDGLMNDVAFEILRFYQEGRNLDDDLNACANSIIRIVRAHDLEVAETREKMGETNDN